MTDLGAIDYRDFDWFAIDRDGAIALFATGGSGFVPCGVVSNYRDHDRISSMIPTPRFGSEGVWDDIAEQGLFVFDWYLWNGPYKRLRCKVDDATHSPEVAAAVQSLPSIPRFNGSFRYCLAVADFSVFAESA